MPTAISRRRLAALEAQQRAALEELWRRYFDRVEIVLGARFDEWLDLASGDLSNGIPADVRQVWHDLECMRVAVDPVLVEMQSRLRRLDPASWSVINCEVCDETNH